MSFEGFTCWNQDLIQQVMNTEALQVDDAVFLATHHPVRMYRKSLRRSDARREYDQSQFLQDFLAQKSFAFVPVLGEAGTGKSHLVKWLALNIPQTDNRRIVLIPKGGTNLRDVIERILEGMEGRKYEEYRERLSRATSGMTDARAREILLGNLAVAIGTNGGGIRPGEMSDVDDERRHAYEHIEGTLQPLLLDDLFRNHLLRDGGIIADLVRHTIGASEVRERRETRRQFSIEDLPLNIRGLQLAGAPARQIYSELASDPWLQEVAVEWINLHLEEAIGQLLQIGGDDLFRLMRELRADLANQGTELILLIEDFQKVQGIERALLDAVIEQPNQPDRRLCVLRTALACTTDYFNGVMDTVRDRITFVVSLDREALSSGGMVTVEDFEEFAARYLNAVRLREGELTEWYNRRREDRDDGSPPNRCEDCVHQDTCHTAFGSAHGIGLYPFNRNALLEMYERTQAPGFNPRLLINDVLRHTLEYHGGGISKGKFPSPDLLASFGDSRLSAVTRREIATRDSTHTARREVFVEFWTAGQVTDLPAGVHVAFKLPPLGLEVSPPPDPPPEPQPPPQSPVGHIPRVLEEKLEKLDNWQNGAELDQYLTRELRELVFEVVNNRIDWDSELLVRSSFAGSSKAFKNTSVYFRNQSTQAGTALVRLTIPEDGGAATDASLALQGLLLHKHFGHWGFRWGLGGVRYLRLYARMLDCWSRSVLDQIRGGFLEKGSWDPLPAAVELLAIGARLLGEPASGGTMLENQVAALFASGDGVERIERGQIWSRLLQSFLTNREHLIELVISRTAATKGGSTRVQILDTSQFIEPLRAVQGEWLPCQELPVGLPKTREYTALQKLQDQFRELLDPAIDEERTRALAHYTRVADALQWDDGIKEVGPLIRDAMRRALSDGVYAGPPPEELEQAINVLNKAALVRWKVSMETIQNVNGDRKTLLAELGQNHESAAGAANAFVDLAERFLGASIEKVQRQVEKLEEAGGRDLEACYEKIEAHLDELDALVALLGLRDGEVNAPTSGEMS